MIWPIFFGHFEFSMLSPTRSLRRKAWENFNCPKILAFLFFSPLLWIFQFFSLFKNSEKKYSFLLLDFARFRKHPDIMTRSFYYSRWWYDKIIVLFKMVPAAVQCPAKSRLFFYPLYIRPYPLLLKWPFLAFTLACKKGHLWLWMENSKMWLLWES